LAIGGKVSAELATRKIPW